VLDEPLTLTMGIAGVLILCSVAMSQEAGVKTPELSAR